MNLQFGMSYFRDARHEGEEYYRTVYNYTDTTNLKALKEINGK
jgi:hypothetical protein